MDINVTIQEVDTLECQYLTGLDKLLGQSITLTGADAFICWHENEPCGILVQPGDGQKFVSQVLALFEISSSYKVASAAEWSMYLYNDVNRSSLLLEFDIQCIQVSESP
ncbi:hypothetical protein HUO09_17785 [Vibrio sp. Y2-5]|uniref:hypothetical protein n=1 Tax=Vibrio sp. Y2-5 TaxID=2743977 RepID=UPI0016607C8E|nr:hypothetical protein [Vibrio sp. Y2-5]MBD0788210.1 hypothetical protein [Vibrio sp. Y2-5]